MGPATVALTVGAAMDVSDKGWGPGLLNSGIDAIPFVGTAKGVVELGTGDLISDQCEKCK